MRNVQIEETVAVLVAKRRRRRPSVSRDPELPSGILETAVPEIAIEHIGTVVGHIEIHVAIIVEVPDGHAHPVAYVTHARLGGDVGERAVCILSKESIAIYARLDEIDVEVAVAVNSRRKPHRSP